MTFFGILWMLLIIWSFCKTDIRPMMALTLVGMIWQCNNVFSFNGISCGPQLITSAFFILKSVLYSKARILQKIKSIDFAWFFFLLYIPINVFILNPEIANKKFLEVLQITVYIVTFKQFYKMSVYVDAQFVDRCIKLLAKILFFVGIVQLCIEFFKLPKDNIFAFLVYNDKYNTNICYYNKNVIRLYSTFMEPSYCSAVFVGLFFYYFFRTNIYKPKKRIVWIIILGVCTLLTQSSTAYGTIALLLLLYMILYINNFKTWIALSVISLVGLYLLFGTNLLQTVIFDKFTSGSGIVRANMNFRAWENFLTSKMTGVGYGNSRGSSILFTMLGELGIIGFLPYLLFLFQTIRLVAQYSKTQNTLLIGTTFMVIAGILSQVIACPDLDLSSFWLTMYFFALGLGITNQQKKYSKINYINYNRT